MDRYGPFLLLAVLCTTHATASPSHMSPVPPTTSHGSSSTKINVDQQPTKGSTVPPNKMAEPPSIIGDPDAENATMVNNNNCTNTLGFDKCRSYGKTSCHGIYEVWAKTNCEQYCGYCTDPSITIAPCVDVEDHCESYDRYICTNVDYRIWAEDHCRKFCGFCGDNSTTTAAVTTPTPTKGVCTNYEDCDVYNDEACVGIYAPWAHDNCPLRCGYCPYPEPCFNKISYCDKYSPNTCTDLVYRIWARRNCRKHCGICYNQTNEYHYNGTGTHPTPRPNGPVTTVHPMGSTATPKPIIGPGTGIGQQITYIVEGPPSKHPGECLYKGNPYKLNERWYDGCKFICECFDTIKNRMICTDRCTHWRIPGTVEHCRLVQEPGECCEKLECKTI